MTAERWRRVKDIFNCAVECSPDERAALLNERCGTDPELLREVQSLLANDRETGAGLASPIASLAAEGAGRPFSPVPPLLPERYEVLGELGSGGMGIVYRARDRETGEVLALKILKPEIAADSRNLDRFRNELLLAHRITHPNVARLYEFHRAGSVVYLSMEYVEGESLRALLTRDGRLDLRQGLSLAAQMTAGIAEAHRQEIVHRDLKPENIMLTTAGQVKVMDFGISRSYASALTATGVLIGTPAYMAPEQAEGKPVGAYTDIYALGLILYEMFTGAAPFRADTAVSLALMQIGSRPQPPRELVPELPRHMEAAILRCLEKNPEARFQSAEELIAALEGRTTGSISIPRSPQRRRVLAGAITAVAVTAGAGGVWLLARARSSRLLITEGAASLAVLPFADMSAGKDQEYFAEGVAEELRDALAQIPGLRVTGRNSSAKARRDSDDIPAIGRKLQVTTLLEGSVRRQGNRVRVAVQLINAADGSQMWSGTFDHEMNDILGVQDKIAQAVTAALRIPLLAGGTSAPSSSRNRNPEAYDAWLQGQHFRARQNREDLERAVGYFQQAIRLDPSYAPAWVGLGDCRTSQAGAAYIPAEKGYAEARDSIERALILDPKLAEAHAALGVIRMLHDWDWEGADTAFRRALALKPGDAGVLRDTGSLARLLGNLEDAIRLYRLAIDIDPLFGRYGLALVLHYAGRQEEAMSAVNKALELTPEFAHGHVLLCRIHLALSQVQEARSEAEKETDPVWRWFGLALAYHASGHKQESDTALAQLIARFGGDSQYQVAGVLAFRGERDRAFTWLERAYAAHDSGISEMKADPLLRTLHGDARYEGLLRKLHLSA